MPRVLSTWMTSLPEKGVCLSVTHCTYCLQLSPCSGGSLHRLPGVQRRVGLRGCYEVQGDSDRLTGVKWGSGGLLFQKSECYDILHCNINNKCLVMIAVPTVHVYVQTSHVSVCESSQDRSRRNKLCQRNRGQDSQEDAGRSDWRRVGKVVRMTERRLGGTTREMFNRMARRTTRMVEKVE